MGVGEDAEAWKDTQRNDDYDYDVKGPYTVYAVTAGPKNAVRVFMAEGQGNINLGNNPYYAADGAQDHPIDHWGCSAEGGVVVAYVVKVKKVKGT